MFGLKYKGCVPIKRWLDVNASRSLMSSLKGRRGLLLRVNSTPVKNILNDSSYSGRSFTTDFNDYFVSFTIDSQELPIHGLDVGFSFQVTPLLIKEFSILVWFRSFNKMESSLLAPIKFLPLSVQIAFGFPLLAINLIKVRRKLSVVKSPNKSKCKQKLHHNVWT